MSLGKLARQLEIQLGALCNVYIFLLLYIKPVFNPWARSEPAVRLNNRESCVTLYRNRQQEAQQSLHYVAKLNCPSPDAYTVSKNRSPFLAKIIDIGPTIFTPTFVV